MATLNVMSVTTQPQSAPRLRHILIRYHRIITGLIFAFALIATLASIVQPLLLKHVFDSLPTNHPIKTILFCTTIITPLIPQISWFLFLAIIIFTIIRPKTLSQFT